MSKFKKTDYILKYPTREKALSFTVEDGIPFKSAVIGVTEPIPDYSIEGGAWHSVGIEYVLRGEGEVLVDGKWIKARSGHVFILREGEKHKYRARPENPWHKLWINYNASYIGTFLDAYGIKTGVYHAPEALAHFEYALELSNSPDSFSKFCYSLAKCVHSIAEAISECAAHEGSSDYLRIRDALDLSVYKKVDLNAVADALHMSKSNMIRIFKKHSGKTPYDYLLTQKIESAKLLLSGTDMPIREIANKLCVLDEHYFSALFLKREGMRPSDFRKGTR